MDKLLKRTLILLAVLIGIAVFLWNGLPRAREAARMTDCRNRLKAIGLAFFDHKESHSDLPRNADGEFSLLPFTCEYQKTAGCIDLNKMTCVLSGNDFQSFVLSPLFTAQDLNSWTAEQPKIVLAHAADHLHGDDQNIALLLLSDGAVQALKIKKEKYQKWLEGFRTGEPGSNQLESLSDCLIDK